MIQKSCSAINLNPVNQALIIIPNPHVSLNISITHSPHQIIIANIMKFQALPNCGEYRMSMIAMAIKSNSRDSLIKETGIGMLKFRFMMNQFAIIKVQKTPIFHLNAV